MSHSSFVYDENLFDDFLKESLEWFSIPVIRENLLESMRALKEKRRPKLL
jgi:hypothetical protein